MHSNTYSPKMAKNCQTMVKNGKKWQKIANNCKISEITKYGENWQQIAKNVKKMPKTVQNGPNGQKMGQFLFFSSFFWLETTQQNSTSRFHTMFGSKDTNLWPFLAKIHIFGSKFYPDQNFYSYAFYLKIRKIVFFFKFTFDLIL